MAVRPNAITTTTTTTTTKTTSVPFPFPSDSGSSEDVATERDAPTDDHNRGYKYFDGDLYGRLSVSQKRAFFSQFQESCPERIRHMKSLQVEWRKQQDPELQHQLTTEWNYHREQNDNMLRVHLTYPDLSISDLMSRTH